MKQLTTVLLAGAFALATTVSFAQVGVGLGSKTSGGAAVGTGSGTSGSTNLDASGNATVKKKSGITTGSGAAGIDVNGTAK